MTKETAIRLIKAKTNRMFNSDFNFDREFAVLMQFENWCVDDAKILTWAEIDAIEA